MTMKVILVIAAYFALVWFIVRFFAVAARNEMEE